MLSLVLLCFFVLAARADEDCSESYVADLDPAKNVSSFLTCMAYYEGKLLGAAYWSDQGLTKDGCFVNDDGSIHSCHEFSAPSKESLHLGILALALSGSREALLFLVSSSCQSVSACLELADSPAGRQTALSMLDKKLTSLERFNSDFPGFGGFVPWFTVNEEGAMQPVQGWEHQVPALDNGEMIFGLMVSEASSILSSLILLLFLGCERGAGWLFSWLARGSAACACGARARAARRQRPKRVLRWCWCVRHQPCSQRHTE